MECFSSETIDNLVNVKQEMLISTEDIKLEPDVDSDMSARMDPIATDSDASQKNKTKCNYPPMASIMAPNLTAFSGLYNFSATVPESTVRNKWFYSSIIKRVYTGKNTAFPVKITMANIQNSTIVLCPIYTNTEKRCPVRRCPTCKMEDPSDPYQDHILRVEGIPCSYDTDASGNRIVQIPISQTETAEEHTYIHVKIMCRTSCAGGPNRRLFCILVLLVDVHGMEVGRDVIDCKCCESPVRDLQNDEKRLGIKMSRLTYNKQKINGVTSLLCLNSNIVRKSSPNTNEESVQSINSEDNHNNTAERSNLPDRPILVIQQMTNSIVLDYPPIKPILVLNITPFAGPHNFSATIPDTAIRNKWYYSSVLRRVYTKKNVAFPVKITVSNLQNSAIVLCPVYANTEMRTCPMKRCPTCQMEDPSDQFEDHIIRVQGVPCSYGTDPNGHKIVRMLTSQLKSDQGNLYVPVKLACRTSCPGGPNRRMFLILVLLVDSQGIEVGRGVVDIKCCESAARDMQNDEKRHAKRLSQINNVQEVTEIVSSLRDSPFKKRKIDNEEEYVQITIPKQDEAKVKDYAELLRCWRLVQKTLENSDLPSTDI